MAGDVYLDLNHLVLDLVYYVVELQKHVGLDDAVMILAEFGDLLLYMAQQSGVGLKMHGLDVQVHGGMI
jgi:hypothetical protein